MKQILLEVMLNHMEHKEVMIDSQQSFTKSKSCLTNFVAFYDVVTGLVGKAKAVDVITWTSVRPLVQSITAFFYLN